MLVALFPYHYAGQKLKPGDCFEAKTPRDEQALLLTKRARAATAADRHTLTTGLEGAAIVSDSDGSKARRKYKRRDMTAEEP